VLEFDFLIDSFHSIETSFSATNQDWTSCKETVLDHLFTPFGQSLKSFPYANSSANWLVLKVLYIDFVEL
jgi:hypothetical protein